MNEIHPHGYADWLSSLKTRIRDAKIRTVIAVNSELILLYWQIGREILERQARQGWGTKVIKQLASDLSKEFPAMKGLSRSNLMNMRAFAEAWKETAIVQQLVGQLPWGHNILLINRSKVPADRIWYAKSAIEHNWSRSILMHHVDTQLHLRAGAAITNFKSTLPSPQFELAQQLIKDPMIFDFLDLDSNTKERDLEDGLIKELQKMLIELGTGFAFIGRQYHLEVAGQDFYLDLLFYNTKLHCYIVVDLKINEFKPEHVGKVQFYLTAVDEQLKTNRDDQSIGLILCKTKNGVIAEYALRDSSKPIGVAEYRFVPPDMAGILPSLEQLEERLSDKIDMICNTCNAIPCNCRDGKEEQQPPAKKLPRPK